MGNGALLTCVLLLMHPSSHGWVSGGVIVCYEGSPTLIFILLPTGTPYIALLVLVLL